MQTPTATPHFAATRHAQRAALLAALCTTVLWATACASNVPVPNAQMASAQVAVADAATAGAADLAPTELRTARDKLNRAQVALVAQENEHAERLATEAQADANLAEVKARNVKAQKTAAELREGNRVLREELQRSAR